MKQFIPIILILAFSLTSCIDIVEKVTINENKSGSISIEIENENAGLLVNIVNNLIGNSYEDQIKDELKRIASKLSNEEGIHNVEVNFNDNSGRYGISCDFLNTKDMNRALYKAFGYKKNIFSPSYLKANGHKLKKINISPHLKKYLEKENITIPDSYIVDLINYKCIYQLPANVNNTSNNAAKINKESNTVVLEYPVQKVLNNEVNTGIVIRY